MLPPPIAWSAASIGFWMIPPFGFALTTATAVPPVVTWLVRVGTGVTPIRSAPPGRGQEVAGLAAGDRHAARARADLVERRDRLDADRRDGDVLRRHREVQVVRAPRARLDHVVDRRRVAARGRRAVVADAGIEEGVRVDRQRVV